MSKTYRLTRWFTDNSPGQYGVFQRQSAHPVFAYWDGKLWYLAAATPAEALEYFQEGMVSSTQEISEFCGWRGLATETGVVA